MSASAIPSVHAMRTAALAEAFGSNAAAFAELLEEGQKVNYDSYKYKVTANKAIHQKRAELAKKVPKFWLTALNNCQSFVPYIDPIDKAPLEFLEDVWIEHGDDPRDFEIRFTFSAKNPYFKETVLSKKVTVTPPSTSDAPGPQPYDLEAPSFTSSTKISWTSPDHDLVKKSPRVNVGELENYDEFAGFGSFFNWFGESGADMGLSEDFLEWWGHALEYAAGMVEGDDDDSEEGMSGDDDDDEEDDDLAKEIDLESEDDRPKKKSKK